MCVIIHKKKKTNIGIDDLKLAWDNNPHGAGFSIFLGDRIDTKKGFMKFEDLIKALKEYEFNSHELILHFRIATHGAVNPENCHPFICHDTKSVFYHNGIVSGFGHKNLSDTKHFFESVLLKLEPKERNIILETYSGSNKFIFIDNNGKINKFGNFEKWKGLYCSNLLHTIDSSYFFKGNRTIVDSCRNVPYYEGIDEGYYDADGNYYSNSNYSKRYVPKKASNLAKVYDSQSFIEEDEQEEEFFELDDDEIHILSEELEDLYIEYRQLEGNQLEQSDIASNIYHRIAKIENTLLDSGVVLDNPLTLETVS